jgi:hypothetical protein
MSERTGALIELEGTGTTVVVALILDRDLYHLCYFLI